MKETYKPTEKEIKKAEGMMTEKEHRRSEIRDVGKYRDKKGGIEEGKMSRETVCREITSELLELTITRSYDSGDVIGNYIFNEYGFKFYLQVKNPENIKKAEKTRFMYDGYTKKGEDVRYSIDQSDPLQRSRFPELLQDGRLIEIRYQAPYTHGIITSAPLEGIDKVVEKLIDKLSEFKNEDKVEEVIENIKNIVKLHEKGM